METVQLYETTVADRSSGYAFRFLAISQRSLRAAVQSNDPNVKEGLAQVLGLQQLQPVRPSALPQAILGMLHAEEASDLQQTQAQAVLAQFLQPPFPSPELLGFAEQIAFTDLIPFEESPINLVSLASKAATLAKSPIALGAFIGVVAGGTSVFLLVTVPAGIILCGTAAAFAKVVDARRDEILSQLLGIPPKGKRTPVPPAASTVPPSTASVGERPASAGEQQKPESEQR